MSTLIKKKSRAKFCCSFKIQTEQNEGRNFKFLHCYIKEIKTVCIHGG